MPTSFFAYVKMFRSGVALLGAISTRNEDKEIARNLFIAPNSSESDLKAVSSRIIPWFIARGLNQGYFVLW